MQRRIVQSVVITGVLALATLFAPALRAADEAAPAKAKTHQYTGYIETIDNEAHTVTVKHSTRKDNSMTFQVGDTCRFKTAEKTDAAIADFKSGDKVLVKYTGEEGEQAVAKSIQIAAAKKGKTEEANE